MQRAFKICAVAGNELAYNPRLMKALDQLQENGWDCNGVFMRRDARLVGQAEEMYRRRGWRLHVVDSTNSTCRAAVRHYLGAALQKCANAASRCANLPMPFATHALQRNATSMRRALRATNADIYFCNLPENLPTCQWRASKTGASIWYDAQEFFRGQGDYRAWEQREIKIIEDACIRQCGLVTAPSVPLAEKLMNLYPGIAVYPIHNVPKKVRECSSDQALADGKLQLYWRGSSPALKGRGINNILQALKYTKSTYVFTIQGDAKPEARRDILHYADSLGVAGRIAFKEPASPDYLVEAGCGYDIGLAVEPGSDQNQQLTSSNKIFEYMMAGLAVVASDVAGLRYVVERAKCGVLVDPANPTMIAEVFDRLSTERDLLDGYKKAAKAAAFGEYNYENEFRAIYGMLESLAQGSVRRSKERAPRGAMGRRAIP